ncbi:MAG: hypothetical protein WC520_00215 [Candidatus Paceibacterota bacterium]
MAKLFDGDPDKWMTPRRIAESLACSPHDVELLIEGLSGSIARTENKLLVINISGLEAYLKKAREIANLAFSETDNEADKPDKKKTSRQSPGIRFAELGYLPALAASKKLGIELCELRTLVEEHDIPIKPYARGFYIKLEDVEAIIKRVKEKLSREEQEREAEEKRKNEEAERLKKETEEREAEEAKDREAEEKRKNEEAERLKKETEEREAEEAKDREAEEIRKREEAERLNKEAEEERLKKEAEETERKKKEAQDRKEARDRRESERLEREARNRVEAERLDKEARNRALVVQGQDEKIPETGFETKDSDTDRLDRGVRGSARAAYEQDEKIRKMRFVGGGSDSDEGTDPGLGSDDTEIQEEPLLGKTEDGSDFDTVICIKKTKQGCEAGDVAAAVGVVPGTVKKWMEDPKTGVKGTSFFDGGKTVYYINPEGLANFLLQARRTKVTFQERTGPIRMPSPY